MLEKGRRDSVMVRGEERMERLMEGCQKKGGETVGWRTDVECDRRRGHGEIRRRWRNRGGEKVRLGMHNILCRSALTSALADIWHFKTVLYESDMKNSTDIDK